MKSCHFDYIQFADQFLIDMTDFYNGSCNANKKQKKHRKLKHKVNTLRLSLHEEKILGYVQSTSLPSETIWFE